MRARLYLAPIEVTKAVKAYVDPIVEQLGYDCPVAVKVSIHEDGHATVKVDPNASAADPNGLALARIAEDYANGKVTKVSAIKAVRNIIGYDLKEAKALVEDWPEPRR